jgi:hypothetical protein
VHLPGDQYVSGKLVPLRGRKVEVLFIDGDTDAVEVFFDGRHVCTAENLKGLSAQTAAEFYAARAAQRRAVRKAKRDHLRGDEATQRSKPSLATRPRPDSQKATSAHRGARRDPDAVRQLLAKAARAPGADLDRPYKPHEEAV